MKIQDIFFLIVFIFLFLKGNPRLSAITGLSSLLASIPLFSLWIFFTAQHLVWYAGAFLLLAVMQSLVNYDKAS